MNKSESGLHNFHLIMDEQMINDLTDLDIFQRIGSFSGLIVKILRILSPRLEKEHLFGEERMSHYKLVNNDPGVKREGVHVYMPGDVYRRLKLMHQDLNFYSIAQLTRWILQFYLDLVVLHGEDMQSELGRSLKEWRKKNEDNRFTPKYIQQLLLSMQQKPGEYRLLNIYNNLFSPAKIYLL